jgi:hypothetical protein
VAADPAHEEASMSTTLRVDDDDIRTIFTTGTVPSAADRDASDGDATDADDGDATDGDATDATDGDATDAADADGADA